MHKKYIFSNVIGTFVFNEHFSLLDKKLFKNSEQYKSKDKVESELSKCSELPPRIFSRLVFFEDNLSKKYKNLKKPEEKELGRILEFFKKKEYFKGFYEGNLKLTKEAIKASVKDDLLIIQTISSINEIDKSINILIKRLREWYGLYNPEFENSIENQERFVELVLGKSKKELLKEIKVSENDSMGAEFSKEEIEPIMNLAKEVNELYALRRKQEIYLEKLMKKVCPNLLAITGATIGAKLIEQAGGLRNLMLFPASTVQLLGAEKALFRHMKTKSKAPKHGFIVQHPLVSSVPEKMHGKIARALADKISIAVKVDYFKGKFIGDKLRKELEEKFKK